MNYKTESELYLKSLKPKYNLFVYFILLFLSVLTMSLFIFRTYDIFQTKGYLQCEDKCYITVSINYLLTNKIKESKIIKIKDKTYNINNIEVSEIISDDKTLENYQMVKLEVDQLDNGILNTFQDIKIYSNNDYIINKIKKVLL